jgi:hypothetical protein
MRPLSWRLIIPAFAGLLIVAGLAVAGDGDCCCQHCGRTAECRQVCRLVCEEKKVETICWSCKAVDYCLPGPSEPGCKHCEDVCDSASCPCHKGGCCRAPRFVWREWTPGCAKVYTKKKLLKKVVVRKIPSHKWVTEILCDECAADCSSPTKGPATTAPPVQAPPAKMPPPSPKLSASND